MHMMVGGLGVLAILVLIAIGLLGFAVVWRYLPAILAAIGAGTLAGLLAALAAESKERSRARTRPQPPLRGREGKGEGRPSAKLSCPYCGGEITPELAVCPTCFRDLKRNCPSCGAVVAVGEARCPRCGEPLPPVDPLPSGVPFHTEPYPPRRRWK